LKRRTLRSSRSARPTAVIFDRRAKSAIATGGRCTHVVTIDLDITDQWWKPVRGSRRLSVIDDRHGKPSDGRYVFVNAYSAKYHGHPPTGFPESS
jgi:hypothetical protein